MTYVASSIFNLGRSFDAHLLGASLCSWLSISGSYLRFVGAISRAVIFGVVAEARIYLRTILVWGRDMSGCVHVRRMVLGERRLGISRYIFTGEASYSTLISWIPSPRNLCWFRHLNGSFSRRAYLPYGRPFGGRSYDFDYGCCV